MFVSVIINKDLLMHSNICTLGAMQNYRMFF